MTWASYLLVWLTLCISGNGEEISGCHGETLTISCDGGEQKINILGDFYGLSPPDVNPMVCAYSDKDICVIPSHSHSSLVKQVCNGRSKCIFTIAEKHTCTNSVKETTYQQIKYECIPDTEIRSMCANDEWASHSGYLTSANYPLFYPPNISCTCTLYTDDASFILLKTAELRLKATTPCRDYLRVEPALNPEEDLCGSVHRIYEARSFTLHFTTHTTSYKGFMLSYEGSSIVKVKCFSGSAYTTTPTPTIPTPTVSAPSDEAIISPSRTPEEIKSNLIDTVDPTIPEIIAEENSHEIVVPTFSTADKTTLSGDVKSASNGDYLQPSLNQDGATYRMDPKTQPTFPSDLSPSVKAPVLSALHTVSGCFGDIVHFQCKDGEMIRILQDMYGSAPSGRCAYEPGDCAVEAIGQKSIVSQICSSKTRCMNFIVTRTFCGERVTSYQEITYECVPATALTDVCAETVITSSSGFLASPNFPGMYPRNMSCTCTLRAAQTESLRTVTLSLAHFALHDIRGCEDSLEVDLADGNPARTLCGSQHGHFSSESIRIHFKSDARFSHSGFWLHYEGQNETMIVIACNVPVHLVWPNDVTSPVTTASTTPTPVTPLNDSVVSHLGDNISIKRAMMPLGINIKAAITSAENETFIFTSTQNDVDETNLEMINSIDVSEALLKSFTDKDVIKDDDREEENYDAVFFADEEIASIEDNEVINETALLIDVAKSKLGMDNNAKSTENVTKQIVPVAVNSTTSASSKHTHISIAWAPIVLLAIWSVMWDETAIYL